MVFHMHITLKEESERVFVSKLQQATIFLKISLKCELASRSRWRLDITPVAALDSREGFQRRGHLTVVPALTCLRGVLYIRRDRIAAVHALACFIVCCDDR
ncbi:uncharacterized protein LOC120357479 [Solenopsis invicta]|uniref:uncharacterized protein LOC120357479 n=1 Tax=Solenopsis invicta TaxID=13686 RepID=UPI00193E949A|nr:uncharacterized protein LOC120357479 [Solenopsis invicta]